MKSTVTIWLSALLVAACSSTKTGLTNNANTGGAGIGAAGVSASGAAGTDTSQAGSGVSAGAGQGGVSGAGDSGVAAGAGSDGGAGTMGAAGAAGGGANANAIAGCGTSKLLKSPDDTSALGPWSVGVKTVTLGGGRLVTEIWYPAKAGSEQGRPKVTYDLRDWLPNATERAKVTDTVNKIVTTETYRDLPIDLDHGPYPVMINIHGTYSIRIASARTYALWASRGFVVVSADYPGLFLTDQLKGGGCGGTQVGVQDLPGDVSKQITALTNPTGDLAFLAGAIDMTHVGVAGHSQGGGTAATSSTQPNVQVVIPLDIWANTAVPASSSLKSVMVVAGVADAVGNYQLASVGTYNAVPSGTKKRLVGITGGGHLVVTDMCDKNSMGKNSIQVMQSVGVCGLGILPSLFDCGTIDVATGTKIVNYATTAAIEETLQCQNRDAQLADLETMFPQVGDYQHAP